MEKQFQRWDYNAVRELEQLCSTLPILPRKKAMDFFNKASQVTKSDTKVVERQSSRVFESLMGFVSASDREDFTVTCELSSENLVHGVLMLETYDSAIGVLFCVTRISEDSFLTHGFTERQKEAIRGLRESSGSTSSKKCWQFWK